MKFSIFIINLALTGALDVLDAVNKGKIQGGICIYELGVYITSSPGNVSMLAWKYNFEKKLNYIKISLETV